MQPQLIPPGLCQCGCGGETNPAPKTAARLGWVKGQPLRYLRGHQNRRHGQQYREEERGFSTRCWVWLGYITPDTGYGKIGRRYAHRIYFEQANGPIPEGLVIDHLCRVRECVNPAHMEVVTNRENVLRGESRSAQQARQGYCKRGHPLFGDNLYEHNGKRQCRTCRAMHLRSSRSVG